MNGIKSFGDTIGRAILGTALIAVPFGAILAGLITINTGNWGIGLSAIVTGLFVYWTLFWSKKDD